MTAARPPLAGPSTPPLVLRLGVHAAVYLLGATMVLPFAWMVATSLKTNEESLRATVTLIPEHWRWGNYAEAVEQISLGRFYFNSFVVAGATTVLAGVYNALAGYAFAKLRFRGRAALYWLTLATMMLPVQVFFIFAYIIAGRLGYIDTLQGLVVPFLASGFGVLYMRQAIGTVPDALVEAARIDGMTDFEILWHVVTPNVWPAIGALAVFTFVASWNSFFWPLIVIDSNENSTLPLAVAALAAGKYVPSWPVQMAAATILTLPLVVVFLVFQRAFVGGVALTGIKE